jgi:hypothetical protein
VARAVCVCRRESARSSSSRDPVRVCQRRRRSEKPRLTRRLPAARARAARWRCCAASTRRVRPPPAAHTHTHTRACSARHRTLADACAHARLQTLSSALRHSEEAASRGAEAVALSEKLSRLQAELAQSYKARHGSRARSLARCRTRRTRAPAHSAVCASRVADWHATCARPCVLACARRALRPALRWSRRATRRRRATPTCAALPRSWRRCARSWERRRSAARSWRRRCVTWRLARVSLFAQMAIG